MDSWIGTDVRGQPRCAHCKTLLRLRRNVTADTSKPSSEPGTTLTTVQQKTCRLRRDARGAGRYNGLARCTRIPLPLAAVRTVNFAMRHRCLGQITALGRSDTGASFNLQHQRGLRTSTVVLKRPGGCRDWFEDVTSVALQFSTARCAAFRDGTNAIRGNGLPPTITG
jgi:hypothetical protein